MMSIFSSTKNKFKNFISPCYACCSFISIDQSGFCSKCKEHLFNQIRTKKTQINGLRLTYLFDWIPNENRPLSLLLEDMKRGGNPKRSSYYGLKLTSQFLLKNPNCENVSIVPAPAKRPGDKDHAYLLAESIHQVTGWQVFPVLGRMNTGSQKHKKRRERQKTTLSFESFSIDKIKTRAVIFIDDIVTTGATAEAAYKALGQPAQFHILSIAHRRLGLAGA